MRTSGGILPENRAGTYCWAGTYCCESYCSEAYCSEAYCSEAYYWVTPILLLPPEYPL
ncbi:hypothetical protein JOF55_003057 [Haloactinomyces albus]|uniref:Uncharacterized protein n=1 Tax=Haloactinomyces albus TaxID=1352928 RepID=A0AAE4CMX9_9ACTN|nr:hypothetical protein [Haloactinomyces albus]